MANGPNYHPIPINAGVGGGNENTNDRRDYSSTHANAVTVLEEEYASTATSSPLTVVILNSTTPTTKNWSGESYDPMSIA